MNKPLPVSLPTKPVTPDQAAPKRTYRTPAMVEYGNVRELTKGTGSKGLDKNGTRRNS